MSARITNFAGGIVAEKRGGARQAFRHDPLGSTIAVISDAGTTTATYNYWPYGEVRSSTGSATTPWKFCGRWGYYEGKDTTSYVRARVLKRDLARWMTVDPLWPEELPYTYADCTPIVSTDPTGNCCLVPTTTFVKLSMYCLRFGNIDQNTTYQYSNSVNATIGNIAQFCGYKEVKPCRKGSSGYIRGTLQGKSTDGDPMKGGKPGFAVMAKSEPGGCAKGGGVPWGLIESVLGELIKNFGIIKDIVTAILPPERPETWIKVLPVPRPDPRIKGNCRDGRWGFVLTMHQGYSCWEKDTDPIRIHIGSCRPSSDQIHTWS